MLRGLLIACLISLNGYSSTMANTYSNAINQLDKQIAELSRKTDSKKDEIAEREIRKINLAIFKGDFTDALAWIKNAKQPVNKNSINEAELLDAEGELYFRVSDMEIAKQKWNQSFTIKKNIPGLDSIYIAQGLARLARIASFNIEIDKAYQLSLQAVQILERHTEKITEVNAGEIYREYAYALKIYVGEKPNGKYMMAPIRNEYFKAIKYSEQSLGGKNNYYRGQLLHDIGNTYNDETFNYRFKPEKLNKLKQCVDSANIYYDKAIKYNRQFYGSSDRISVTYFVKGLLLQCSFLQDSFPRALFYYNESIRELLPSFKPVSLYDNPLPDSAAFDKAAVIQNIMYKGRLLADLYKANHDTSLLKYEYQQFHVTEDWYKLLLSTYQSKEFNLIGGLYNQVPYPYLANIALERFLQTKDRKYIPEIYRNLELKNYYTILTSTLDKNNLPNYDDIEKAIVPLENVQQKLDNKSAILEFFDGDYVTVITHSNIEFVSVEYRQAQELRNAIHKGNFKEYKSLAYKTYQKGFLPIKKHLQNIENIIIEPNAYTALLPFDALLSDTINCKSLSDCKGKYLINQYTFQFAFSSSLWAKEKIQLSKINLLSFAPTYVKYATIKFNQDLITELNKKYEGNNYEYAQATKSNFISSSHNSNDVIHLAVHGEADVENCEFSKLIFSGENDTSYLGFADIAKLHLQSPLVVLAACKTQEGRNYSGEGLLNFPRAFALAGASSIVSSIWSVDDKATSILLKYFYENLNAGTNKSEALRKAKLSYLSNCSEDEASPLYWSGIILNGDDAAIEIRKRHQYLTWILSAIGLVILAVVYWKRKVNV